MDLHGDMQAVIMIFFVHDKAYSEVLFSSASAVSGGVIMVSISMTFWLGYSTSQCHREDLS